MTTATTAPRFVDLVAPGEPDSAARRHLTAALAFLVVSGLVTLLMFVKLPYPSFAAGNAVTTYGRLRPIAISTTVFGWLTLAHIGAAYYLVPRLTGARLWNERLANLGLWLTVVVSAASALLPAAGLGEGRPWAGSPWWLDLGFAAALGVPVLVVTRTVANRREESLYVSLWYLIGGLYWVSGLFILGNIPNLYGAASQIQSSFFASGVTELWLLGAGLGSAYYLIPKITGNPLYNRQLALVGFWSLAFAGAWVGQRSYIYGPAPDWLETSAAVLSISLLVAALAVVTNLTATMQGRWTMVRESIPLRFVFAGTILYLLTSAVNAAVGYRSVASVIGLTTFGEGTLMLNLWGAAGLLAAGLVYHALPRMFGRRLFSERLAGLQLRLTIAGVGALAALLWLAGIVSGYGWNGGAATGAFTAAGDGFVSVLDQVRILYILAVPAVALLFAGQVVFAYNAFRTFTSGAAAPHEMLVPLEEPEPRDE